MRSIILAAGRGSRLGDVTADRPKLFLEIHDETIYERQMSLLEKSCDEAVVVLGHGFENATEDEIRDTLHPDCYNVSISWIVIEDWASIDNAASLGRALSATSNDQHSLIINGDIIFEEKLLDRVLETFADRCVSTKYNIMACIEGYQNAMTAITHDKNGIVTDYGTIKGHQYTGISVLHSAHIETAHSILEQNNSKWYPICFPETPTKKVYVNEDCHQEINTPEHLAKAKEWLQQSALTNN